MAKRPISMTTDYAHGYDAMDDAMLMNKCRKGWRCDETPCGTGSTVQNSAHIRSTLPDIVERYGIRSVVDAGAGDLNWMRLMSWGDVRYLGVDLYPRHPDVIECDITKQILPRSDLILCRHVLNHLSIEFAKYALERFAQSNSKYLLMTMCDTQAKYWREYDLRLPDPIETFPDCQHWRLELYDQFSP